jgi:3-(3-hydroxy-phenyl)propionate hydroxylase
MLERPDRSLVRLDDLLGNDFGLIALHPNPQKAFEGLPVLPFEQSLNLKRLCITPRFYNPFPPAPNGEQTIEQLNYLLQLD